MADVSLRPAPGDSRRVRGGRSRGQLLLVTALAMAVLLVSLALLLNTAIYTENLATRSADPGSSNAVSYQRDAVRGVGGIVDYVNAYHAESDEALHANLTASVREWDDATARHAVVGADATAVSLASTTNGTQAVQNRTRNFTAADGTADWNLTTGVAPEGGLRAFRLSVRPDELASGRTGAFRVDVSDDAETRSVYVYRNGSTVEVDNGTDAGDADCSATPTNGTVAVDLSAGTVGGRACEALPDLSDPDRTRDYNVSYANGGNATGTYSVVVNQSTLAGDAGAYDTLSSGNVPYSAPAVYAVTVDVAFESQRVTYETSVRVAPGETDD